MHIFSHASGAIGAGMKYTYAILLGSAGWPAGTYLDPEIARTEIISLAKTMPTGYLGTTSDKSLAFKGVTIRFKGYVTQIKYGLAVEFIDAKRIEPGFFEMWMLLVAAHIVNGEPSKRVVLKEGEELNPEELEKKQHVEKLIGQDKSNLEIAHGLGMSKSTLQRRFKKWGITRRPRATKSRVQTR
jgi:hypothetical protein